MKYLMMVLVAVMFLGCSPEAGDSCSLGEAGDHEHSVSTVVSCQEIPSRSGNYTCVEIRECDFYSSLEIYLQIDELCYE